MKRPPLRAIVRVLFYVYLALVLLTAGVDLLLGFKNIGAFNGDTVSGLLKFSIGLPGSLPLISGGTSGWSRETVRILLWGPILLNLLVIGSSAFVANRNQLHVVLVAVEAALLLVIVDVSMALACTPGFGSLAPSRFWREALSFLTTSSAFECSNIPWVALLILGSVLFAHLFYLMALMKKAVPKGVS